jgi:hypothetical protein
MLSPLTRTMILVLCTASTMLVLGRAPGAVNLRTRDIETTIAAEGRTARDAKARDAWLDRGKS